MLEEQGTDYLYYTGVTEQYTQSIMLAISTDPSNPQAWQPAGMIVQPNHAGMIWQAGAWADSRDPMVIRDEDRYFLLYSGRDVGRGIVGLAKAPHPTGPWTDLGPIIPADLEAMPESPTLAQQGGVFYMFYNRSYIGEIVRTGSAITGTWSTTQPFKPGWAHEVWQDASGAWFTSYLTDYTVSISHLSWDPMRTPEWPFVGESIFYNTLPLIRR